MRALQWFEPVLGLPDTLRARAFVEERERLVAEAAAEGRSLSFDFAAALEQAKQNGENRWKPLRGDAKAGAQDVPVLPPAAAAAFRARARQEILALLRTLPSLQESETADPPDDWTP